MQMHISERGQASLNALVDGHLAGLQSCRDDRSTQNESGSVNRSLCGFSENPNDLVARISLECQDKEKKSLAQRKNTIFMYFSTC